MTSLTLHLGLRPQDLPDIAEESGISHEFRQHLAVGLDSWHTWGERLPRDIPAHCNCRSSQSSPLSRPGQWSTTTSERGCPRRGSCQNMSICTRSGYD